MPMMMELKAKWRHVKHRHHLYGSTWTTWSYAYIPHISTFNDGVRAQVLQVAKKKEVFFKQKKRSKLRRNNGFKKKKSDTHAKYSVDSQHEPLDENRMQEKRTLLNVRAVRRLWSATSAPKNEKIYFLLSSSKRFIVNDSTIRFFVVVVVVPFKSSFFRRFRLSRLKPLHTEI